MTKLEEMEKRLEEYLDERYQIMQTVKPNRSAYETNKTFYDGASAAITQIGGLERTEDGKHYVELG